MFAREGPAFDWPTHVHNAHLIRARAMQGRIVTLLVEWMRSGECRFRTAALAHLRQMSRWRYWSWILWRRRDSRPDGIFDLSYGENAATLALAWDWLHATLPPAERRMLVSMARRRPLAAFLAGDRAGRNWWFREKGSNWNTVCAGGLGMLMLTMREELPEADGVLKKVETSFVPFMRHIDSMGGGWPEGIGYWGYGMRYAFMYLLSRETATGRTHPLLKLPGVRRTLDFPLDFSPHGVPCSFGDANSCSVNPIQYLLAERFGRADVTAELARRQTPKTTARQPIKRTRGWPDAAETLLFFPRKAIAPTRPRAPWRRHYAGLDWLCLADRWPGPNLYLSIRGGTTDVHHGHMDLTSFHLVAGNERMIVNTTPSEYLDSTFTQRRYELFEMTPASKNVLRINGLGLARPARVAVRRCRTWGPPAVRIDATAAVGVSRDGETLARSYTRLFVLLDDQAVLVADSASVRHYSRFETRFFSPGTVRARESGMLIRGRRQWLRAALAADQSAHALLTVAAMTSPGADEPALIRWRSDDLHREIALGALFVRGKAPAALSVSRKGTDLLWTASWSKRTLRFRSDPRLSRLFLDEKS